MAIIFEVQITRSENKHANGTNLIGSRLLFTFFSFSSVVYIFSFSWKDVHVVAFIQN